MTAAAIARRSILTGLAGAVPAAAALAARPWAANADQPGPGPDEVADRAIRSEVARLVADFEQARRLMHAASASPDPESDVDGLTIAACGAEGRLLSAMRKHGLARVESRASRCCYVDQGRAMEDNSGPLGWTSEQLMVTFGGLTLVV